MSHTIDSPWRHVVLWLRIVFGVHLVYSGVAYLFGYEPAAMVQVLPGAGQFLALLDQIGMYPYVKYLEIVVGMMLLANRWVPLALVLEMPVSLMIFFLNVVVEHKSRHLFTGPQELFLNASLLLAYGGYYTPFLRMKAEPWWLWDNLPASLLEPALPQTGASKRLVFGWSAIMAMSAVVFIASLTLGPPERILPPRDYVPLICGALVVLWVQMRGRFGHSAP
jgi:riboflavin transporter